MYFRNATTLIVGFIGYIKEDMNYFGIIWQMGPKTSCDCEYNRKKWVGIGYI